MGKPIFHIDRDRLTKLLKTAYELGYHGWLELADDTAEGLIEQCIIDLSKTQIRKTVEDVKTKGNTL